ncbi:MAG: NTP transferase domain-containing protein [Spirosomataceae bacterium]
MNGLILVGGRSTRMGTDKSQLVYHEKPQWQYLCDLLVPFCPKTFFSCRAEQTLHFPPEKLLIDHYVIGPLGGILSAFDKCPDEAWLVVACDMPSVNEQTIDFLYRNRDVSKSATAFQNPQTHLPEPLLTVWEPASYPLLSEARKKGQRSPLRVLQNANVNLLECPHPEWLTNVNTAEDITKFF